MKIFLSPILALWCGFFPLNAHSTENMVGFDIWKSYANGVYRSETIEYEDNALEDSTDNSVSAQALYGRRFYKNFQALFLINYYNINYGNDQAYSATEAGLGVEYNFLEKFERSFYTSIILSNIETREEAKQL